MGTAEGFYHYFYEVVVKITLLFKYMLKYMQETPFNSILELSKSVLN